MARFLNDRAELLAGKKVLDKSLIILERLNESSLISVKSKIEQLRPTYDLVAAKIDRDVLSLLKRLRWKRKDLNNIVLQIEKLLSGRNTD